MWAAWKPRVVRASLGTRPAVATWERSEVRKTNIEIHRSPRVGAFENNTAPSQRAVDRAPYPEASGPQSPREYYGNDDSEQRECFTVSTPHHTSRSDPSPVPMACRAGARRIRDDKAFLLEAILVLTFTSLSFRHGLAENPRMSHTELSHPWRDTCGKSKARVFHCYNPHHASRRDQGRLLRQNQSPYFPLFSPATSVQNP